jgi:hypothetical protein
MWIVYNLKTYEKHFEGTPDECLAYIDNIPGKWDNPIDVCSKSLYDKLYAPKLQIT